MAEKLLREFGSPGGFQRIAHFSEEPIACQPRWHMTLHSRQTASDAARNWRKPRRSAVAC